ncbi:MAG: hypothetical protein BTN85_1128 [Candidatus Methanohalarchaeum thermophilum]|uniref:Uncharacterized protein n=1 Tax=Methanohalarchaeum thermophilum TaxID=1903181 RepID=A0A1Q6DW88_METT1|nr:MAG: hypothetical protein BTN85_1128 [Candidatus Methanohalarchaeum thermophilum]
MSENLSVCNGSSPRKPIIKLYMWSGPIIHKPLPKSLILVGVVDMELDKLNKKGWYVNKNIFIIQFH